MIFDLNISYQQIVVFDSNLKNPFNEWRDEHLAQGFAWRPGSVSFATLHQDGTAHINVRQKNGYSHRSDAARVIAVPFALQDSGFIEIASIGDSQAIELAMGNYRLIFQHGVDLEGRMWCDFVFIPADSDVLPEILRADPELQPPLSFVMKADPA